MKNTVLFSLILLSLFSCSKEAELSSTDKINWTKRTITTGLNDSLKTGKTYLPVYSDIYNQTEHKKHDLVVTASIRNINIYDTIYIHDAKYFNTKGELIRTYFDKTIFIAPLETVEIIIDEKDQAGGSGANFIFNWSCKQKNNVPYFEGIMISTEGQQGLSFTSQGILIN